MDRRIYGELAKRLVRARKACGLTQQRLAEAVGLSRGSIANIERGEQRIHVDTLYLIAAAVAKEARDLLPRSPAAIELDQDELSKLPESVRGLIEHVAGQGGVTDA